MIDIRRSPVYCVDVETTGVKWAKDRVFGVAVAVPESLDALLADPVGANIVTEYFDVRRSPGRYEELRGQTKYTTSKFVNHNIKFDLHMLRNDGFTPNLCRVDCTMIRASLIDEHLHSYSLDALGRRYLGLAKIDEIYGELAKLYGGMATRGVQMKNLHRAPPELVAPYARRDTEVALRLWAWQEGEIQRQELAQVLDLEMRLFPHVFNMERHGIRVDTELAHLQAEKLDLEHDRLQRELNTIAGFEVNPNPSGSMTKLFQPERVDGHWVAVDGTRLQDTPAGKPSINADALERMRHPAAPVILRMRKVAKTKDTFIRGHILGYEHRGRVHPNINQVKGDETGGTGTGRLSYVAPALQQIPSRDKLVASIVRPIFLPDEGQGWSYGDLDQHELRIFHHYVNNPVVVKAYRDNPDLDGHQIVADLTGLPRNPSKTGGANAKQMNLGAVFCMGQGTMAEGMGLPYTMDEFTDKRGVKHEFKKPGPEAQAIIDKYYEMVPGIRETAQKASSIAKSRGHVKTIFGRHIRFPGGQFTHKASGLVYQGTSADCVKLDIINVCDYLLSEHPESHFLLSIHDEINLSIPYGKADIILPEARRLVLQRPGLPVKLRVPIMMNFSQLSDSWWGANCAEEFK